MLNETDFRDEFSHTILHNQNVFDEFRLIQQKKKSDDEKKKTEEAKAKNDAEIQEKMAKLKLDQYQPKFGQDPAMFNEMYMNYIN